MPLEAVIQFQRHLLKIRKSAGFNFDILPQKVGVTAHNMENAGVTAARTAYVNMIWDLDQNKDLMPDATNGLHLYRSTCLLSCFLYVDAKDPLGPELAAHAARTRFHADLVAYFWPAPGTPNRYGLRAPWTLPTENDNEVVRFMSIVQANTDADFQKLPTLKYDILITIAWGTIQGDLYYPA